jgi:hypothetical protein
MIVRLAIRLVVLAVIVLGGFLIALFSWLAEPLLPAVRRGKHAHRAPVHDPA